MSTKNLAAIATATCIYVIFRGENGWKVVSIFALFGLRHVGYCARFSVSLYRFTLDNALLSGVESPAMRFGWLPGFHY